jgi:hypothetical protein
LKAVDTHTTTTQDQKRSFNKKKQNILFSRSHGIKKSNKPTKTQTFDNEGQLH